MTPAELAAVLDGLVDDVEAALDACQDPPKDADELALARARGRLGVHGLRNLSKAARAAIGGG